MASKKVYLGEVEFKLTKNDIEHIMKEVVSKELQWATRRLEEYPRAIRTLQNKVLKLENKLAALEMKKK